MLRITVTQYFFVPHNFVTNSTYVTQFEMVLRYMSIPTFMSCCGLWVVISKYKHPNFQGSRVIRQIGGELLIFRILSFFKAMTFFFVKLFFRFIDGLMRKFRNFKFGQG